MALDDTSLEPLAVVEGVTLDADVEAVPLADTLAAPLAEGDLVADKPARGEQIDSL